MATVIIPMNLKAFDALPGVAAPTTSLDFSNGQGATLSSNINNAFPISTLVFPDYQTSAAYFAFSLLATGAAPAPVIGIDWMGPVTGGVVRWGAQLAVYTNASTPQSLLTKACGPARVVGSTAPAASWSNARSTNTLTITEWDAIASASTATVILKVFRDGGDTTNDTFNGPAYVRSILFSYQDA